ncbi:MAG: hypothetical protein ACYCQH_08375 [Acidithiobacillus ferrooxidans]|jgi:hypothetical protein|uniref:hypothetical protein n=1 Tax=Acidithiobacillus ferrooxidans TaxID=920 RepID=UPI0013D6A506|nr:hypothetical protein [Acidithiobacillus ferrooxidans]MCR2829400.1 hypothetical protein [Acidithiobacillus ferrooxidans]MDA8378505.1 hypothetical protein [Planctomycetia bacterium]
MGMMDYIIGKNVGRESGRATDSAAVSNAQQDAHDAEIGEIQMQTQVYRLIGTVNTLTKRFTRERQERRNWQLTAEARKLSMKQMGMTEAQVIAKQKEILADPVLRAQIDRNLDAETAEIDAELGIMQETSATTQEANNSSFQ